MDGIYWIQRDIPHWTNILQVYLCSLRHRFVGGWHLPAALGNSYLHLFLLRSHHVNSSYEVLGAHFYHSVYLSDSSWFLKTTLIYCRFVRNGKHYQDSLKGIFCAKTNISLIIQDNQDHRELSIKPFLLMVGIASMFLGLVYFYFFSALNYRFFSANK